MSSSDACFAFWISEHLYGSLHTSFFRIATNHEWISLLLLSISNNCNVMNIIKHQRRTMRTKNTERDCSNSTNDDHKSWASHHRCIEQLRNVSALKNHKFVIFMTIHLMRQRKKVKREKEIPARRRGRATTTRRLIVVPWSCCWSFSRRTKNIILF